MSGGDHGLKVHAGKQSKVKTDEALLKASKAALEFAINLEQEHVTCQTESLAGCDDTEKSGGKRRHHVDAQSPAVKHQRTTK